uniref:Secreted protein n=1 Tax=Laticauda laticaudata TaxID=8630 RepID=A0A8C5RZ16_LATLA
MTGLPIPPLALSLVLLGPFAARTALWGWGFCCLLLLRGDDDKHSSTSHLPQHLHPSPPRRATQEECRDSFCL